MKRIVKEGLASIIIVNYNGLLLLGECLDSLIDQSYKKIEIIVVDNGSKDGSDDFIERKYSDKVKLIKEIKNTGFAGGNNIGMRHAQGEYIILINNDTKTDPGCVQNLVQAAMSGEKIGMCAAKLLTYASPNVIDAAGHLIYEDGLNQGRGRFEVDRGQYEKVEETIYPPGCGALYKSVMLDEIGLFDDDFFAYGEDTDIGLRARLFDWKALYVPKAIIYHKISQTGGQYSNLKLFFVERNRLFVVVKNYPALFLVSSFFYTAIRYWVQLMSLLGNKGASKKYINNISCAVAIRTLISAYISFLVNIPRLLRKRFKIRSKKKIRDAEFAGLFKRFGISAKKLVYNN